MVWGVSSKKRINEGERCSGYNRSLHDKSKKNFSCYISLKHFQHFFFCQVLILILSYVMVLNSEVWIINLLLPLRPISLKNLIQFFCNSSSQKLSPRRYNLFNEISSFHNLCLSSDISKLILFSYGLRNYGINSFFRCYINNVFELTYQQIFLSLKSLP
jgi:hypothetical protein